MGATRQYNISISIRIILLLLLLCVSSCKDRAKDNKQPESKAHFDSVTGDGEVKGVKFHMVSIAEVKNGKIGYENMENNDVREISLTAYKMLETEVTQELFEAVMGVNPSFYDNTGVKKWLPDYNYERNFDTTITEGEEQKRRPVEHINWYQALAFCNKLSVLCGLEPCYKVTVDDKEIDLTKIEFKDIPVSENADEENAQMEIIRQWNLAEMDMSKSGFRLPTEAEWEWAAKAGTENRWSGTDNLDELKEYAWYIEKDHDLDTPNPEDPTRKVHEVKRKKPNAYGLYDMSGNCVEMCWDWFTEGPDSTPSGGQDPTGADSGDDRAVRGGCWDDKWDVLSRMFRYKTGCSYREPDSCAGIQSFRFVCR